MSLVDKVGEAAPVVAEPAKDVAVESSAGSEQVVTHSDWYYDENIKGEGNRPEWLKDKYKTAADQAKAYVEVEKRLGAFKGAPDKYDLALPDHPDIKFSEEDPMLKGFLESAKKNGASQEYVSELLTTYAHALTANIPDTDAEIKSLGANGAEQVQLLAQWASENFSKDEYGVFKGLLTTAASVRFFERVRMLMTQSEVAPPSGQAQKETEEQVLELVGDPRYNQDEKFRADVRRRLSAAMGNKKK